MDTVTLVMRKDALTSTETRVNGVPGMVPPGTDPGSVLLSTDIIGTRVSLLPMEIDIYPSEEVVVPADVGEVQVSANIHLPTPFSEVEFEWVIEKGSGSTLSEQLTQTSFGYASTTLNMSHVAGGSNKVGVRLRKVIQVDEIGREIVHTLNSQGSLKATSDIVVGPGPAATIALDTDGLESLRADGTSEMTIKATFADAFGNPVAVGSSVNWHLQGGGMILQADQEISASESGASVVTAILRAGAIPGLAQKLVIETDLLRHELLIPNRPLSFTLAATPHWITNEGATSGTVTLIANVNARDGTPIRWATSRGQLSQTTSIVLGGVAQTTVHFSGAEANFGRAVFTAAVGKSITKASVVLPYGEATFDAPSLAATIAGGGANGANAPPAETWLRLRLPEWAGQSVRITAEELQAFGTQPISPFRLEFENGGQVFKDVLLDAEGKGQVLVRVPDNQSSGGLAGIQVQLPEGSGEGGVLKTSIPVQGESDGGNAGELSGPVDIIAGLVSTVAPSNGDLTPEEEAELQRAFAEAFVQAQNTGFVSGLLELFPLEGGGGLPNQAAHANWRLRLAEFLDGQTAALRQAAEEADKIHINDGNGVQIVIDSNNGQTQLTNGNGLLMEVDFGAEVIRAIRETSGNASWIDKLEKTLEYAKSLNELISRSTTDFRAFIPSYSSSTMMVLGGRLVGKLGRKVFSHSRFEDALEYFTPEGTTRLLKSLDEFTQTVQANQSIFAGLVFEDIGNNLLKPKLNEWALADGRTEAKMAAAAVGYQFQGLVTFGTLAASLSEASNPSAATNLIKRMGGQLTGLAISAALGSQQAQDELWRMCPFVSWDLLKDDTKALWDVDNYFGAGQKAAELALSIVGDSTLLIPLAKGVGVAAKLTGGLTSRIVQSLEKASSRFARIKAPLSARAIELNKTFKPAVEWISQGTGNKYKVFKRKDIDWNRIRTSKRPKEFAGKTNREAAQAGYRPELSENEFVTVHHSQQSSKGPLFECSTRYHNAKTMNKAPLHPYGRQGHPVYPMGKRSTPGSPRQIWEEVEVDEYWKWRVNQPN